MLKAFKILSIVVFATIAIYLLIPQDKKSTLDITEIKNLKNGDIIVRKESNMLSDMFAMIDPSGYSHIGIVYDSGDDVLIYHLESNDEPRDLKIVSLDKFSELSSSIAIYRYDRDFSSEGYKKLLDSYVDVEFDYDFLLNNEKLYCSEFVNDIYFRLFGENIYSYLYKIGAKEGISIKSIMSNSRFTKIYEIK